MKGRTEHMTFMVECRDVCNAGYDAATHAIDYVKLIRLMDNENKKRNNIQQHEA